MEKRLTVKIVLTRLARLGACGDEKSQRHQQEIIRQTYNYLHQLSFWGRRYVRLSPVHVPIVSVTRPPAWALLLCTYVCTKSHWAELIPKYPSQACVDVATSVGHMDIRVLDMG